MVAVADAIMAGHFAITLIAMYFISASFAAKEKAYYLATERVNVTYWNPTYLASVTAITSRYSRRDPKYYLNANFTTLLPIDNNYTVDFLFYEYRSNEYRRGFVEMQFHWCDLVQKDIFFGPSLRANGMTPCPLPVGNYYWLNCSVPELPLLRTFPFRKGRMYVQVTRGRIAVLSAYVDIEIKQKTRSRR